MAGITFFDSKECEWADMTVIFSGSPLTKHRRINSYCMEQVMSQSAFKAAIGATRVK